MQKTLWYGYLIYASFLIPLFMIFKQINFKKIEKLNFVGIGLGYLFIFILTCDWCRHMTNAFLLLTFLILYLIREQRLKSIFEVFQNKWRYLYCALFLLPAAGVEIPRLVKIFQLVHL